VNKYPPRIGPRPKNWKISESGWKWGLTKMPQDRLEFQTEKFVNYSDAMGRWYADWEAAWRYWLLEGLERRPVKNKKEGEVSVF
jgi:hypothetical protein